jgi:hypothetical protein
MRLTSVPGCLFSLAFRHLHLRHTHVVLYTGFLIERNVGRRYERRGQASRDPRTHIISHHDSGAPFERRETELALAPPRR